jgi:uncharacterized membrane protein
MKRLNLGRTLVTGVVTLLPLLITLYLLYWLAVGAESVLGGWLRQFLPPEWTLPGLGLAAGLLVIFLVGLAMRVWVVQRLVGWSEAFLYRIPVVRSVYGSIRDFLSFLAQHSQQDRFHEVVAVRLGEGHVLGFVTRTDLDWLSRNGAFTGKVAVYFPMSYQIGGYTVLLPRSVLEPVDLTMEEAMRFVLTAGVGVHYGDRWPPSL